MISKKNRERLRAMRQKYGLGEYKNKAAPHARRHKRTVSVMARKKYSRRHAGGFGGMGGMNKWIKIAAFSVGGAIVAPMIGLDGKLGGAAGGFFAGGPIGGVLGYVAGAPIANAASGMLGMKGSNTGGVMYY